MKPSKSSPLVSLWLDKWSEESGVDRAIFEAQLRMMLHGIFDEIQRRAEANMLKTGKLEGMHYAAMKDVMRELL